MNAQDFAYWLQGFLELRDADPEMAGRPITPAQEKLIRDHLALVFTKVTPSAPASPFTPINPLPPIVPYYPDPSRTDGDPWWWRDQIICTGTTLGAICSGAP